MSDSEDDDYFEGIAGEIINFPPEVQRAIDEVIPSDDPLDQPNFNVTDYINSRFPSEQSLSTLEDVLNKMEAKIKTIDDNIRFAVRGQTNVGMDGKEALLEAQKVIRQLFSQISEIKFKAEQSEETVREITRDIKQLDCAKRNLTSAITTLNHLHMLVGGVETLKNLTERRQYGEIVMPLQAVTEVMEHFHAYTNIPQIKELAEQVKQIQTSLAEQITDDFKQTFSATSAKNAIPNRQLDKACLVVSILDPKVKNDLLKWFVSLQLSEYQILFSESEGNGWLDKLDSRYNWFKKHLMSCEEKFGNLFPLQWEVSERITVEFCNITKNQLTKVMAKRNTEIDVKLLLSAIHKTVNLENLLSKRFTGVTLNATNEEHPFSGIISECFQPYLFIYINSLDQNLYELMEKAIEDSKIDLYKEGLPGKSIGVLPSCGDLFILYKKCLLQCAQLSNGSPMLSLTKTFQKYLREYASKVLQSNLPKVGGGSTISVTTITRDLRDLSTSLIPSFLKEGETTRFNKQEQARICSILTTAEYCLETTQQLEKTLKDKIDPVLVEKINLSDEQDVFHNVISNCIQLLVQDLELACEPALTVMVKTQWQNVESVGDQSPFVTAINGHFKSTVPLIRDNLVSSRKYFTQFCFKFANSFTPKFIESVYKCKPLSTAGAEQLLLDTHMLKTILLDLPLIGSQVNREAPQSYRKVVIKGMTKAEMILKVVMTQTDLYSAFVDQFIKLLPESDAREFQKVLEMKGLRTADKNQLINLFKVKTTNYSQPAAMSPKHDSTNYKKLENIVKKNF